MSERPDDDFDGIDINGPWGGIRIGSGGVRVGRQFVDGDDEYRQARQRVRDRLNFYRNIGYFVVIIGILAAIDGATGGGWWVQWPAMIWAASSRSSSLAHSSRRCWGHEAEDRMVEQEVQRRRRRGRIHVEQPPEE